MLSADLADTLFTYKKSNESINKVFIRDHLTIEIGY